VNQICAKEHRVSFIEFDLLFVYYLKFTSYYSMRPWPYFQRRIIFHRHEEQERNGFVGCCEKIGGWNVIAMRFLFLTSGKTLKQYEISYDILAKLKGIF
jgi:hypothetical protein